MANFLRPRDVAERLNVKIDVVLGWIHAGELPAVNVAQKRGRRPRWRIEPAGLEAFLLRRSAQPPVSTPRRSRGTAEAELERWGISSG